VRRTVVCVYPVIAGAVLSPFSASLFLLFLNAEFPGERGQERQRGDDAEFGAAGSASCHDDNDDDDTAADRVRHWHRHTANSENIRQY